MDFEKLAKSELTVLNNLIAASFPQEPEENIPDYCDEDFDVDAC